MFKKLLNFLIQPLYEFAQKWIDGINPTIGAYLKEAVTIAIPIVQDVEEQVGGGNGEKKKQQAVDAILAAMANHNIGDGKKFDLPGHLEADLAGIAVESAVKLMKERGGNFFAGAAKFLTLK